MCSRQSPIGLLPISPSNPWWKGPQQRLVIQGRDSAANLGVGLRGNPAESDGELRGRLVAEAGLALGVARPPESPSTPPRNFSPSLNRITAVILVPSNLNGDSRRRSRPGFHPSRRSFGAAHA